MQVSTKSSVKSASIVHVGLDDTDSTLGKCTTHAAYRITDYLLNNKGIEFVDYPLLIRLNPNIPWKTRGNGAVCLRFRTSHHEDVLDRIMDLVHKENLVATGANPGIAVFCGETIPYSIQCFARKALYDVVSRKTAEDLTDASSDSLFHRWKWTRISWIDGGYWYSYCMKTTLSKLWPIENRKDVEQSEDLTVQR